MQIAERISYVLVGLLIGGSLSGAVALQGQTTKKEPRIQSMQANVMDRQTFSFVKDSKSGACWLMAQSATDSADPNQAVALAPAPKEACQME